MLKKETGFSLIELLLSMTILSVIGLAMFSFFTQAMTYTKTSQNKTAAVFAARNAVVYFENLDFAIVDDFLGVEDELTLSSSGCVEGASILSLFNNDVATCTNILSPKFNDLNYEVNVTVLSDSNNNLLTEVNLDDIDDFDFQGINELIIPIKVCTENDQGKISVDTCVRGAVIDENLRYE